MQKSDNSLIIWLNGAGVAVTYVLLGLSLYLAPVDLSTKGYWGFGILMLTLSLINFVKYRFDDRLADDRLNRLEEAKNHKILEEYVAESKATEAHATH